MKIKTESSYWIILLNGKQLMWAVLFDWEYIDNIELSVMNDHKVESFYFDMFKTNICLN